VVQTFIFLFIRPIGDLLMHVPRLKISSVHIGIIHAFKYKLFNMQPSTLLYDHE
jgi:hypothetical protein